MVTTEINYKGNGYTCRIVESNDGEQLIIGGLTLMDVLMPHPITEGCRASPTRKRKRWTRKSFSTLPMPI